MSSLLTFKRGLFRPLRLESMFLFVTSTCNSLCRTCFYWDELNSNRDLSFEQLETISATGPQFHKLWISGGEPAWPASPSPQGLHSTVWWDAR